MSARLCTTRKVSDLELPLDNAPSSSIIGDDPDEHRDWVLELKDEDDDVVHTIVSEGTSLPLLLWW